MGQILRHSLFLQDSHDGRDRWSIFGKSLLTSSSYILPIRRKTPESNKSLQITLGPAVIATQGQAAVEVAQTYARARAV